MLLSNPGKGQQLTLVIQNLKNRMQATLHDLSLKKCWKSHLKTVCRRNKVSASLVNAFTIKKFKKFLEKMSNIQPQNKERVKSSVWLENELKAYQWFLLALSSHRCQPIQNFSQSEWQMLSAIFGKQSRILEYQAIRLTKQRQMTKRPWGDEQTNILQTIIRQDPLGNKWNEIARRLFDISKGGYFRSGKQCRQRWLNHLDPNKKHGQWLSTEDRKIAAFVVECGRKWSEIARTLGNARTEHMVKNRYKTLIIMLRKKYQQIEEEHQLLSAYLREEEQSKEEEQMSEEEKHDDVLEVEGLPVLESEAENSYDQHFFDKYLTYRELDIHNHTVPTINYQSFTPNFLNTPNSLTFLLNYSFEQFETNQNLFLNCS